MQAKYFSGNNFAAALALAHTAKKRAEIAPGVGKSTDMFMVTKTGWAPVEPQLQTVVEQTYDEYDKQYSALLGEQYKRLAEAFKEVAEKATQQLPTAATPQLDESPQLQMPQQKLDDNKSAVEN
jgi:phosphoglycolate phosphatase-like HAD superfamily hydrolase